MIPTAKAALVKSPCKSLSSNQFYFDIVVDLHKSCEDNTENSYKPLTFSSIVIVSHCPGTFVTTKKPTVGQDFELNCRLYLDFLFVHWHPCSIPGSNPFSTISFKKYLLNYKNFKMCSRQKKANNIQMYSIFKKSLSHKPTSFSRALRFLLVLVHVLPDLF